MYSPELESRVQIWRQKCADGTITQEDYKEVVALLRQNRFSASTSSSPKPKTAAVSAASLLERLKGAKP